MVGDVRSLEVTQAPQPEMYQPLAQTGARSARFVVRSNLNPAEVLEGVRQFVRQFDSRLPVIQPGTMEAMVDEHLARPRFYLLLLSLFSGLAIILAAVASTAWSPMSRRNARARSASAWPLVHAGARSSA